MQNNIFTINLSSIRMRNLKIPKIDTQNKSTNTNNDLIIANQRFNSKESEFKTINIKKSIDSYFFIQPKQKKNLEYKNDLNSFSRKDIIYRNKENFLPMISKNNRSVRANKEKSHIIFDQLKSNQIKIKKKKELIINPVSLYLFTLSNEKNKKKLYSNKNKGNKIRDEFLERVKDYRRRLKEQMIKRNKFQYSHSNNSLNNSQNQKREKESDKEKENNENRFNYNQANNYIFNMNENVDKALNRFYNKLKISRIPDYDKEKICLNPEKSLSNLSNKEIINNNFYTINIK
jgi:hypothetical protein